ncbi:MAG: cardiolipin synthase [Lacunisphaera sp.]
MKSNKPKKRRGAAFWKKFSFGVLAALGLLYWLTDAWKVSTLIKLSYGPTDHSFAATLGPAVGAEFVEGNAVQTLVNGDEFFPSMLQAIREAKSTITLETYIWESGKISDQFIEALGERARAGVRISVIVDGMGVLKFKNEDWARLEASGVNLLKYGRAHWYDIKANFNNRTHRKSLVIDGRVGFTGGMDIADKWMGNATSTDQWRDTQVRVEGPVVHEMQAVFATNWLQTTSTFLAGEDYFPVIHPAGTVRAQCFKSGPGEGAEAGRLSYLFAIAAARKSIEISHAYFVPDDLAIETLIAARQRGVRIRVIVPAINDSRIGRAASRSRWGKLLKAGVEFYQFEPAMFHVKSMIVDDVFVTVGSVNFDDRSFQINDEISLNILDRATASDHLKIFENDLRHSTPLTREEFESRPFYIKLTDHLCGLIRSQL